MRELTADVVLTRPAPTKPTIWIAKSSVRYFFPEIGNWFEGKVIPQRGRSARCRWPQ